MSQIIDLSQEIHNNMPVYPGDDKTNLTHSKHIQTDKFNDFRLETSMHVGTHIDSPMHLTGSQTYICQLPLNSFMGNGVLIDGRNQSVIGMKREYKEFITENCILLIYTGFNTLYGKDEYYSGHPCIDMELCEFLIAKRIKMIGFDMPSPDKYPFLIHKTFLNNNIFILENLTNLDKLINIDFNVIALPIKIKSDSSMTRAIAITL